MPRVVVCDVHERPSRVPAWLARLGVDVRVESLKVGDYRVAPEVLVERKTVRSVHTAVAEGTFWAQIGRLRRSTREAFLLIEGANLDHGSLSPPSIRGVCLSVMEQGIHLIRASTPYDSALWLIRLCARSEADPRACNTTRPRPDQERSSRTGRGSHAVSRSDHIREHRPIASGPLRFAAGHCRGD
jgi:ERCC4-type nuclease